MVNALLIAVLAATALAGSSVAAPPAVAQDVERYLAELERIHPQPYHATPQSE